jgi:outer membrane protein assembly factor BamB
MQVVAAVSLCALFELASDWPQWRGPERTDLSHETGDLQSWPPSGPPLLWTFDNAGVGYSGPAIVGERLYTMGGREGQETVFAIDTKNGKEIWATPFGGIFTNNWGDGPRGTPTVDGELLFAIGGQGDIVCLEAATGKERWKLNMQGDLGGQMMSDWGYTESPLVDGDKLVCSPGGSGGTLAALDKKDGKVIWRSKDLTDPAAYSSIILAEVGGIRQYVQVTGKGVAGVAAKDGQLLWHYEKPNFQTAVIPTPIFHDGYVYITAGYGAGCDLIKLVPDGGTVKDEKVYANRNMMNHHGGVVLVGDYLYGYSDSERGWICQEFKTGNLVWAEKRKLGKGSITCVGDRLYCYSEDQGTAVLIEASPAGWKEHGRFTIPRETTIRKPSGRIWTHPVVANGRLYLRDQDLLFCFDVKDHAASAR